MVQAVVFFHNHGTGHLLGHRRAMTVLEGPHTIKIKKAHAVAVVQDVTHVGLEAGHGAQLPVDESDPTLLRAYPQTCQQIGHGAPVRKVYVQVGETHLLCLASMPCQSTVQPHVYRNVSHFILQRPAGRCPPRR